MGKRLWITLGAILLLSLIVGILIYFGIFSQSAIGFESSTLYNTLSSDANSITYSDISTEGQIANAFKSKHTLSSDSVPYFSSSVDNKKILDFYLENNGVDISYFTIYSGSVVEGVLSLNNFESYANKVWDESDNAYKYVLDDGSSTPYYDEMENLGFVWDYRGVWKSGSAYKSVILSNMGVQMDCYVEGSTTYLAEDNYIFEDRREEYEQDYKIYGGVSYESGFFVCNVNTDELFDNLPETFTRPDGEIKSVGGAGIDGKVVFEYETPNDGNNDDGTSNEENQGNNSNSSKIGKYVLIVVSIIGGIILLISLILYLRKLKNKKRGKK